jgi:hypothetical protein
MADNKASKLESFINKIPGAISEAASYTPPGLAFRGAKAVGEAIKTGINELPEPVEPGLYQSVVAPAKQLVSKEESPQQTQQIEQNRAVQSQPIIEDFISPNIQASTNIGQAQQESIKDTENKFIKSIDDQKRAKEIFLNANARQAEAESEALKIENARINSLEKQQEEERRKQLAINDQALNEYKSSINDLESSKELNQNRYWSKAGTGEKVLAGIALLFGSAGNALGSKTNPGLEVINSAIDKDLEAQKEMLQRKETLIGRKQGILNFLDKKFDNIEVSQKAAKLAAVEAAQRKMNEVASQFSSPKIKAQAAEANAVMDQQKAKILLEFQKAYAEAGKATLSNYPIGEKIDDDTFNRLNPEAQRKAVVLPDGSKALAISDEAAKEYRKFASETMPAVEGIDRITQLAEDYNKITDLQKKAQIQSELKALAGQLRLAITGPGPLTEQEYNRLQETIGDPTKLLSFSSLEKTKLQQVKSKLINDIYTRARQSGIKVQPPSSFKRN